MKPIEHEARFSKGQFRWPLAEMSVGDFFMVPNHGPQSWRQFRPLHGITTECPRRPRVHDMQDRQTIAGHILRHAPYLLRSL